MSLVLSSCAFPSHFKPQLPSSSSSFVSIDVPRKRLDRTVSTVIALACNSCTVSLHESSQVQSQFLERLRSSIRRIPNRGHQASLFSTCCSLGVASFLDLEPSSSNAAILGNSHEVVEAVRNMKLEVTDTSGATLRFIHHLSLADLDPATAKVAIGIIGPILSAFSFLFILRVIMSWYPKLPVGKFPYVIAYAPTEPFLVPTRKLIPPLAGVDITPVVWVGLTNFLNEILVGPQGLLVLLSQQVN